MEGEAQGGYRAWLLKMGNQVGYRAFNLEEWNHTEDSFNCVKSSGYDLNIITLLHKCSF